MSTITTQSQSFWKEQTVSPMDPLPVYSQTTSLPQPFEWAEIDIRKEDDLNMLQKFLYTHYGTSDSFSIIYSKEYLRWAFNDHQPFTSLAIRFKNTLVGFCKGWVIRLKPSDQTPIQPYFVTSFLCIHQKYRGKHLVEFLLKELVRRMFILNVRYGITFTPKLIHQPLCNLKYYNRYLNPMHLVESKYIQYPNLTYARAKKLYPPIPINPTYTCMKPSDAEELTTFLNTYLHNYKMHQHFDVAETARIFEPHEGVNQTYLQRGPDKTIKNMFSYHILTLKHEQRSVKGAYILYVLGDNPLEAYNQTFAFAHTQGCDFVTAFDHMNFDSVRNELKFKESITVMKCYLFNEWFPMDRSQLGFTWF
jgi:hypothetical protein